MTIKEAYNTWAPQYDTNVNKTRDIEAKALRETLADISFESCLEIGCGTGKNSVWLAKKAKQLTAVDFSEEMIALATGKEGLEEVNFVRADITKDWSFTDRKCDLIIFSLVLEHIADLKHVFAEAYKLLKAGGHVYIGELHPFKQYSGSKAKFDTVDGTQVLECYTHHVSDFICAAKENGLKLCDINEYFDDDNRNEVPRLLTMLLEKEEMA